MAKKSIPPSIKETAFTCPHCGAYTTQYWYKLYSEQYSEKTPIPFVPCEADRERFVNDHEIPDEGKKIVLSWFEKTLSGLVWLRHNDDGKYCNNEVHNLYLSECYNCKRFSVWVHERLLFPRDKESVQPNPDLPDEIIRDFEEAREIVDASPRGAAALLRLCIQKLCIHLGEKDKDIDSAIASLVSKGLNPLVQKSLDIVRVIGNEAVHPGVINLNDNRDTANMLFELVNSIADQMITHPKNVENLYGKLPENKRKAIEDRNKKAKEKPS
jgi:hypothetical protein